MRDIINYTKIEEDLCEELDIKTSFLKAIRDMPGVKKVVIGESFTCEDVYISIKTENGAYFERRMSVFMIRSDQEAALKYIKMTVDVWMAKKNPFVKKLS